jgi:hypothetical protein
MNTATNAKPCWFWMICWMLLEMVSISATIARFFLATAVAGRLSAAYYAVDEGGSTADALVYVKRTEGAIAGAGPAFHTPVPVQNDRFSVFHGEDPMRAYLNAHSAACAQIGKELKTRHV